MLSYTTVIVTYNRKESIYQALLRQFKQKIQAKKIIVVDNASTDGTKEYISEIINKYPQKIKYIRLSENLGGSGGFYYGMREALKENTDLIAISDDDASYNENYFKNIIEVAEKNPQDMAFCGAIYANNTLIPSAAKFIKNEKLLKFREVTYEDYFKNSFYADVWPFVGAVYRKEMIKKIGLPNKNFFIWFDDSEYAVRMHKNGIRYRVISDAKINLNMDERQGRVPLWKKYYGFRNEVYTIKKYNNSVQVNFYIVFLYIKKIISIFLYSNEYKNRRFSAIKCFSRAFYDGEKMHLGKIIDPLDKEYK